MTTAPPLGSKKRLPSDIFVNGMRVRLDPKDILGKGGEADVYLFNGMALKIYKTPDHPDLAGDAHGQRAATERLETHQRKLAAFPKGLPDSVIAPMDLAKDSTGYILGYNMKLLPTAEVLMSYADRGYRQKGIGYDIMLTVLSNLYGLLPPIHSRGIVIGDFNDLNVLVEGLNVYMVDTDSYQYTANGETFYCTTYTNKFIDPLLCDPRATVPALVKPHNKESDLFAFYIMLMQCLLFVDPYGGIYKPKDLSKKVSHDARRLKRITIFDPEVKYPKPSTHYSVLPDELLGFFDKVFGHDSREEMNPAWLKDMRWTNCVNCGAEHARQKCPICSAAVPGVVKQTVQVRGQVVATREFKTTGQIVYAAYQNGKICYLYHDAATFHREGDLFKVTAGMSPHSRYRIHGKKTIMGANNNMLVLAIGKQPEVIAVDKFGNLPMFDANSHSRYWIANGQLLANKDGSMSNRFIGDVLKNQTLFWVGEDMGFGFYRAGGMTVAFTFDANKGTIKDSVKLPAIKGQLIDSTCCFAKDRAWFFVSAQENGRTINRCYLIKLDGTVVASAEAEAGDGSWLETIRGNCAINNFLLVGTDDGIVRIETSGDRMSVVKEFPDTEPWVNSKSNLFPGPQGVYVISAQEVTLLKIS